MDELGYTPRMKQRAHQSSDPTAADLTSIGVTRYTGQVEKAWATLAMAEWLNALPDALADADSHLLYRKRNRVYRVPDPTGLSQAGFCVKAFKRPGLLRSLAYRRSGSKAMRAHRFAVHLFSRDAAVAEPVAVAERWRGPWLVESYLISRYLPSASDLYTEMGWVLREHPELQHYQALMRVAANAIRGMHDSGFLHGDLGPQNLLLTRESVSQWANPMFIDLNRGRLKPNPRWKDRARDLQRMKIPGTLLSQFLMIYSHDRTPPAGFERQVRKAQNRFRRHQRSRKWRHPIQTLRDAARLNTGRPDLEVSTGQPREENVWLWDDRARRAATVLRPAEQRRYRRWEDTWNRWESLWQHFGSAWQQYRFLRERAWQSPVRMSRRFGVTIDSSHQVDAQLRTLASVPGMPVRVLVHFRLGRQHWHSAMRLVERLAERGHEVTMTLVQNRQAVRQPLHWHRFVRYMRQATRHWVRATEVGTGINDSRNGLWTFEELRQWVPQSAADADPALPKYLGPGLTGFAPGWLAYLLREDLTRRPVLHWLLRREPERGVSGSAARGLNAQLDALASLLLDETGGQVVLTVAWALEGSGVASPLVDGYLPENSDPTHGEDHFPEETVAAWLVRLALLALCSGRVDRLYWDTLAHPGTGLVDPAQGFRARPGWRALYQFHRRLAGQTFRLREEAQGVVWWYFDNLCLLHSDEPRPLQVRPGMRVFDFLGEPVSPRNGVVEVTDRPIYLYR